ncbi:MAG: hypothetical protein ABIH39_05075 [Candidatus Margulisiibacteriota bacterium]
MNDNIDMRHFIAKEFDKTRIPGTNVKPAGFMTLFQGAGENDVLLMTGDKDQEFNRTFLLTFSAEKIYILDREKPEDNLTEYEFVYQDKLLKKNCQEVAEGDVLIKKLVREFKERNKQFFIYKYKRGEKGGQI